MRCVVLSSGGVAEGRSCATRDVHFGHKPIPQFITTPENAREHVGVGWVVDVRAMIIFVCGYGVPQVGAPTSCWFVSYAARQIVGS